MNVKPRDIDLARIVREAPPDAILIHVSWTSRFAGEDKPRSVVLLTAAGKTRSQAVQLPWEWPSLRFVDSSGEDIGAYSEKEPPTAAYCVCRGNVEEAAAWLAELCLRETQRVAVTVVPMLIEDRSCDLVRLVGPCPDESSENILRVPEMHRYMARCATIADRLEYRQRSAPGAVKRYCETRAKQIATIRAEYDRVRNLL